MECAGVGVGVGECSHFSMSGRGVVTVKECAWFSMRRVEDEGGWPLIVLEQCACFSTQREWSGAREGVIMSFERTLNFECGGGCGLSGGGVEV